MKLFRILLFFGIVFFQLYSIANTLPHPPLKNLALSQKRLFGSAVDSTLLQQNTNYTDITKREFSIIVPIDELKFKSIQPAKGTFDFERMDQLVLFAKMNRMKVRGFAPVWQNPKALPGWLKNNNFSAEQLRKILKEHIQNVFSHYKDSNDIFECWEVANEVFNVNGKFKESIWSVIAPDPKKFLKLVFTWAHQANPKAKLFYNDGGHEFPGKKATAIYDALKELKAEGVPIHGVGFQMHLGWGEKFSTGDLQNTFKKFADLGLEIHITEFDVPVEDTNNSQSALEEQAKKYFDVVSVCLSEPKCTTIITWGFTDKHSWIPLFKPGFGRATFLDENYSPKPAYFSLVKAFSPNASKETSIPKSENPQKVGIGTWDIDKFGTSLKLIKQTGFSWNSGLKFKNTKACLVCST
jgi:endo-1,4-beta-xylanase